MKTFLKVLILFVLIALVFGCAHGGGVRAPTRAAGDNVMVVTAVWPSIEMRTGLNSLTWRQSRWHCHAPMETPAMVIISNRHACILMSPIVDVPRVHEFFQCPQRWVPPSNAC